MLFSSVVGGYWFLTGKYAQESAPLTSGRLNPDDDRQMITAPQEKILSGGYGYWSMP